MGEGCFYKNLASIVDKYVEKGSKYTFRADSQTRKWTDKQGVDHYSTEIVANEMKMLGGKTAASGNNIKKWRLRPI